LQLKGDSWDGDAAYDATAARMSWSVVAEGSAA